MGAIVTRTTFTLKPTIASLSDEKITDTLVVASIELIKSHTFPYRGKSIGYSPLLLYVLRYIL